MNEGIVNVKSVIAKDSMTQGVSIFLQFTAGLRVLITSSSP
jgi:hypothetical protein